MKMKKKSYALFLVLLLAMSTFLAACGGGGNDSKEKAGSGGKGSDKSDNVLNLTETQDIPSMDSALATDTVSFTTLNSTMEGLYRLGKNDEAVDGMADGDPQISEDGKTWTFKLRDAKWSNGEPVTANDFVFAWRKALDPNTAAEYAYIMYDIKNAQAVNEGKMKPEELGVKAVDDKTLEVQLQNPVPYFKELLTFGTFLPQNEKYVKEQGDKYGLEANTTLYNGPFTLDQWKHEDKFVLKKNPEYWDADTVKLNQINTKIVKDTQTDVNLFESGDADLIKLSSEFVDKYRENEGFFTVKESSIFFIRMNQTKSEWLKNVDARKAIAMGFDKKGITDVLLNNGSVVADFFVPEEFAKGPDGKDFRESGDKYLKTNLKEAKKHWEAAKKALGQDTVTLELLNYDDDLSKKVGEYIKEQLEKNLDGLTINLKQQPFKQKLDLETKMDYQLSLGGWGADYLDPMTYLDMYVTGGAHNQQGFSNKEYDKLIQEGKTTLLLEPEKRWEALVKAEKILLEDEAAIAPMYQRSRAYLSNPKLEGVLFHKVGPERSYKWAEFK
ncbi:peptide ABC transporter substrate-binding protein [Pseudobacillus wudalianchiensis]|uniref:Periplasmic oligopeptide-binding protein OppA n=1 Tax=Pseudobacillus wudalianchiensis TaxID=1743143 RepID=A0A1B9AU13_9BACI|nr:peptide ABC transporter substrate-binding protein [Bacillus wudalianchiensis]OCA87367.1 peptide ABC transporter substrate-binding protein [Bacillus wudalianchiensis]